MWASFKEKIKSEQDRIKILILVFLLMFLAFGLGYLAARYQGQEPLELIEGFQRTNY